jgi:hypothetical protein
MSIWHKLHGGIGASYYWPHQYLADDHVNVRTYSVTLTGKSLRYSRHTLPLFTCAVSVSSYHTRSPDILYSYYQRRVCQFRLLDEVHPQALQVFYRKRELTYSLLSLNFIFPCSHQDINLNTSRSELHRGWRAQLLCGERILCLYYSE